MAIDVYAAVAVVVVIELANESLCCERLVSTGYAAISLDACRSFSEMLDICRFAPPAVPLTLSVPTFVTSCLVFSSDVTVAAMSDNTGDVAVSCSNTMYHDGLQKPCVNAPVSIIFASPSAVESVKLSKDRLVLVPWRRAFRFSVRSRDDSCGSKGERSLGLITVLPMARRYCNEGNSRRLVSKE